MPTLKNLLAGLSALNYVILCLNLVAGNMVGAGMNAFCMTYVYMTYRQQTEP